MRYINKIYIDTEGKYSSHHYHILKNGTVKEKSNPEFAMLHVPYGSSNAIFVKCNAEGKEKEKAIKKIMILHKYCQIIE